MNFTIYLDPETGEAYADECEFEPWSIADLLAMGMLDERTAHDLTANDLTTDDLLPVIADELPEPRQIAV